MGTMRYVALLRGINVGGRNRVAMADLRAAFDDAGYGDVRTYIQSGNVLFESPAAGDTSESAIEAMLERRFGLPLVVVVVSARDLARVVAEAPDGFAADADQHLSDVAFLKDSLSPAQAMAAVDLRDGVDRAWPGPGVIYLERLAARRTQSRLSRLASRPEYQQMTIRNWRTTTTLLDMLDRPRSD